MLDEETAIETPGVTPCPLVITSSLFIYEAKLLTPSKKSFRTICFSVLLIYFDIYIGS